MMEQKVGVDIILRALLSPIDTIAQNAGKSGEVILDKIVNPEKLTRVAGSEEEEELILQETFQLLPTRI